MTVVHRKILMMEIGCRRIDLARDFIAQLDTRGSDHIGLLYC